MQTSLRAVFKRITNKSGISKSNKPYSINTAHFEIENSEGDINTVAINVRDFSSEIEKGDAGELILDWTVDTDSTFSQSYKPRFVSFTTATIR